MMRLQVFLSHAGVCSRRKALTLIQSGIVSVNGKIVTEPSHQVDAVGDEVCVHGKRIVQHTTQYLIFNKPKGVTTTKQDRFADKTVMDCLPKRYQHFWPVGRLDKDTTGLLLLTNDGDISYRLTHPRFGIAKAYTATLNIPLQEGHRRQLQKGIVLSDGLTAPCVVAIAAEKKIKIIIHEGRKRQVRRMLGALGYRVLELQRTAFGPLNIGDLEIGHWRLLSAGEMAQLRSTHGQTASQ